MLKENKNSAQVPWGIRRLLSWIKTEYNNPKVIITENGISEEGSSSTLDDYWRKEYYHGYINEVLKGVGVIFHETWMTNQLVIKNLGRKTPAWILTLLVIMLFGDSWWSDDISWLPVIKLSFVQHSPHGLFSVPFLSCCCNIKFHLICCCDYDKFLKVHK